MQNTPHYWKTVICLSWERSKEDALGQQDLQDAAEVFEWHRFILLALGLWPRAKNNIRFYIGFGYYSSGIFLEWLDLFPHIMDLEYVIMNLTENIGVSQLCVRLFMLRVYNDDLLELVAEAKKDLDASCYETLEEKLAFTAYTYRARRLIKVLLGVTALTATSFYLTPALSQIQTGLPEIRVSENETRVLYILPYRCGQFLPVNDLQSYVIAYVMLSPIMFMANFIQSAADSTMVLLVFHVCGQMSMLALRIRKISTDPSNCHDEIRKVMELHKRLLRMGRKIDEAYSVILLFHLFSATVLVCMLSYQLLMIMENADKAIVLKFLTYQILILMILSVHCFVGEALLTESTNVYEAFYSCEWYNMPTESARCIILCIARSQKPLCLNAGKFAIFRLSTLTNVLKTSMGYLSVLRSLM